MLTHTAHRLLAASADPGSLAPPDRARLVRYAFAGQLTHSQTVLDIGCGDGVEACLLGQAGAVQVDAIDHDPKRIRITRRQNAHPSVSYLVQSGETMQMNRRYDLVLCFGLLDPETLIRNLFQHLRVSNETLTERILKMQA